MYIRAGLFYALGKQAYSQCFCAQTRYLYIHIYSTIYLYIYLSI